MALVRLSRQEQATLEAVASRGSDAREVRRAEALLWLAEGHTPSEVADQLRISVQTVYNWRNRFSERDAVPILTRLSDAARTGRPPSAQGVVDPLIAAIIDQSPEQHGYQATVWTAPLLVRYLEREHRMKTSPASIRRALKRLGMRWKHPRHVLSRRAEHWRESKGGSSVV